MRSEVAFLFVMLMVVCVLCAILSYSLSRAWGYLADHERRLRRAERRADGFASQDAWDSEDAR